MRTTAGTIRRLARRQRRRLWLHGLLAYAHLPTGWIALVLLIAGTIHQAVAQLPAAPVLLIAAIPCLLYAALSFINRPSLAQAVTRTDLRLQAHSLFIAAWEAAVSGQQARTDMQPMLAARAERLLPQWRERLDSGTDARPDTRLLLALGLSAIGGLLLILPGRPAPLASATERTEVTAQPAAEIADPVALINAALLEERSERASENPQEKLNRAAAAAQPTPVFSDTASSDEPETPLSDAGADPEAQQPTEQAEIPEGTQPLRTVRTESTQTGSQPGSDAAKPTATAPIATANFRQSRDIEIEISETSTDSAFDQRQGSALRQDGSSRAAGQTASQGPIHGARQLAMQHLSVEQRALVKRYLEQLSQNDESTP